MQSFLLNVGEKLVPILRDSKFQENGRLTPSEFVAAGDYLVFKCPTWSWATGEETKVRPYLPKDRQFLVTRNVPCLPPESLSSLEEEQNDPDEFKNISLVVQAIEDIEDTTMTAANNTTPSESEHIPDMDEFAEASLLMANDPAMCKAPETPASNVASTQTFDLYITYDKYYQTPRCWLSGFDQTGQQLTPEMVLSLVSQDHAHKTVTVEDFPHLELQLASVHPCKHAPVMHKIIDQYNEAGKEVRADQYLILFLKFISSIIPSVDYDHTMSME